MKKTRSAKRALLMSALSLLLCVSMLVGTTFAWFTDSVTSANNIIKSGNLDIELEYWNGNAWVDVAGKSDIITNTLWEPGVTEVAYLRVANAGSLALKYQLGINIINEEAGTNVAGESFKLSDYLQFGVIEDVNGETNAYADRESAVVAVQGAKALKAGFTKASDMEPEEELYMALVIYMPTTVGNEANHNGTDVPVINLGINVVATQYTYEEDSFDDQYDAGLTPLEGDEVFVEENGIQYVYTPEGEAYLYLVTEDYAEDTVVVPEGITNIGNYAFAYNNNVKKVVLPSTMKSLGRGFDSSKVETVILNEGLEVIDSRAFRSTPNLKEVVISSTVKTIADNAFQKSGIKNIVIPATVETIGETAFGSSMIESVTFEGNTSIQGYAFRGCSKLRTVHMEGDDVTFIPSTLNGRNSTWFCNGESNNPNTSNITFYVENKTVAARVKTAMGAEANNTPVYVNVADAASLSDALAEGITEFNFMGNEINLNYGLSKAMVPAGTTVTISNAVISGKSYGNAADGTVIFENCTFKNTGAYSIHFDAGEGDVIFKNCELYGWNSFGDTLNSVSFYDCALYGNGTYGLIRSYADLYVENCYIDTTNANHNDNYSEGVEAVSGATLTEKNNTYVATTLSEVMALAKKGNTTIDAKGANLGDYYYSGTFANGTVLKNAKFTYVYGASVDGLATFENCEFVSDHSYSANFSDGPYTGKVVFNNCSFDGWSSFGDAITAVEMNKCTFKKDIGNYGILRFYQDAVLNNCEFASSFEGVDTNKNGTVVNLNNCTGINGKIYNNGTVVGEWIVDGVKLNGVTSW